MLAWCGPSPSLTDVAWQRFRMVSAAHAIGCAGFFTASTAGHSSCLLCSAYGGANMYQELPGQTFCKSCEINTELVSDSANVTVTTCRCKRGARRQPRPRPHIHFIPKCRVEPPAIVASFLGTSCAMQVTMTRAWQPPWMPSRAGCAPVSPVVHPQYHALFPHVRACDTSSCVCCPLARFHGCATARVAGCACGHADVVHACACLRGHACVSVCLC